MRNALRGLNLLGYWCWDVCLFWLAGWTLILLYLGLSGCSLIVDDGMEMTTAGFIPGSSLDGVLDSSAPHDSVEADAPLPEDAEPQPDSTTPDAASPDSPGMIHDGSGPLVYVLNWYTTGGDCPVPPSYDRVEVSPSFGSAIYRSSCGGSDVEAAVVTSTGDPSTITILATDLYDCAGVYVDSLPEVTLNSWDDYVSAAGDHSAVRRLISDTSYVCTGMYTQSWYLP